MVCTASTVGGNLVIATGPDADSIDTTGTTVTGSTAIEPGAGANTVTP